MKKIDKKKSGNRLIPASWWRTITWRKLLSILISVVVLIGPHSFVVQWSKDQTAVTIQK